jgi:hypothetical protein
LGAVANGKGLSKVYTITKLIAQDGEEIELTGS